MYHLSRPQLLSRLEELRRLNGDMVGITVALARALGVDAGIGVSDVNVDVDAGGVHSGGLTSVGGIRSRGVSSGSGSSSISDEKGKSK